MCQMHLLGMTRIAHCVCVCVTLGMGAASVEDQQGTHLHRGQSASVPMVSSRSVGGAQNVSFTY